MNHNVCEALNIPRTLPNKCDLSRDNQRDNCAYVVARLGRGPRAALLRRSRGENIASQYLRLGLDPQPEGSSRGGPFIVNAIKSMRDSFRAGL